MNVVVLSGRLTKDPELRRTASGKSYLRFTLAVNRRFKSPGQPDADFISCVAWGKTAETMANYLHKGSQIGVNGRIETGSYTNNQGQKVYTTDVLVDNFDFLESRQASNGYQSNSYSQQGYQDNYGGGYQQPASQPAAGYNSAFDPEAANARYQAQPTQQAPNSYRSSSANGDQSSFKTPGPQDYNSIFEDGDDLDLATDDLPF